MLPNQLKGLPKASSIVGEAAVKSDLVKEAMKQCQKWCKCFAVLM